MKFPSRIFTVLLAVLMFAACGSAGLSQKAGTNQTDPAEPSSQTAGLPSDTVVPDMNTSGNITDFLTASETAARMGIGWNLGNSFDAIGDETAGINSETYWGNPLVTKELIRVVKAAGFSTIRVPVTWMFHFDENNRIDTAWLERVKTVVDFIAESDMYVIINMHHDGQQENGWLRPTTKDPDGMVTKFAVLWKQIAEYFADCGGNVLFAGMNEFHEGYSGVYPKAYDELVTRLNQTFVDTVRATGGNNAKRVLIFQTYNTRPENVSSTVIPTDSAQSALMIEVHSYDPWNFAGDGTGTWGTDSDKKEVDDRYSRLNADAGDLPVILGEYGATGYNTPDRIAYIEYVTKSAIKSGVVPIWWDNGTIGTGPDTFGIFNRTDNTVGDSAALEAIMSVR
jgi:endoglucanase